MFNYYQFIVPRLNGDEIRSRFSYYLDLVRKGIAGFIVFGGELGSVREGLKKLQEEAGLPLIISSDLEQGLGQQIRGGTLFPPAMAVASALTKLQYSGVQSRNSGLMTDVFRAMAVEAKYAGINTIFAPVLDINTNPKNPIISVRAFGEDPETVSRFGTAYIKSVQGEGVAACGKHFPGHGDTATDSHIRLPVIDRKLDDLKRLELEPFQKTIKAGVKMIMLGHLSVPALDPSGMPVSLSHAAVNFIRKEMRFRGILTTDALNMGGIGKFSEEEAALTSLRAGVDIILHPSDPERIASYLQRKKFCPDPARLKRFRMRLTKIPGGRKPAFQQHLNISQKLTRNAIRISDSFRIRKTPFLLVLNDDGNGPGAPTAGDKGAHFAKILKKKFPRMRYQVLDCGSPAQDVECPDDAFMIAAIFSAIKAWKGGASTWLQKNLPALQDKADLFVLFGSPYLLDNLKPPSVLSAKKAVSMFVYWDSDQAQEAAAEMIADRKSSR